MMTLQTLLAAVDRASALQVRLPQAQVPASFHVTEVGVVSKDFLDCGGTRRSEAWLQLQIWVGPDHDHRLSVKKLAGILNKGLALGFDTGLPVRLECEDAAAAPVAGLYLLVDAAHADGALVLRAEPVRTACLAMDKCLPPNLRPDAGAAPCCGPSGCCGPATGLELPDKTSFQPFVVPERK